MKVLVTGGLGFVGTNLVARLLARPGVEIRILDNGSSVALPRRDRNAQVEVVEADIRDYNAVHAATDGIHTVVHLAAATRVTDSLCEPRKSLQVNVEGTINLLEAARTCGVQQLVLASSNAAVGAHEPPLDETKVPTPISPYGAGKAAGEVIAIAYAKAFGLWTTSLRFSNVYGPFSARKESVVAAMIRMALSGRSLIIYGDGSQTRDFLFVNDLCEAILLAIERAESGSVFQIASGVETPVSVVANMIQRMAKTELGVEVPIRYEGVRAGDVRRNYSCIDLAGKRLGYAPRVPLEEGLRRTWEWFRAHEEMGDGEE